ncbi:MAG: hypothetical protein QOH33_972 [Paraburkholderia sp.]|jgi:hypothetical protein|nr:hypothetical protein [Paraburkholderia sp.]
MQEREKDVAAMWGAIDELDFERIKAKLLHRHRGAMTSDAVAHAEAGYRQFLKLTAKFPEMPVVPSEAVDEFWHMHILDTQRYAADCERIFGYIVHHDPYMGIDGEEDEELLLDAAARSDTLLAREFGAAVQAAYCIRPAAEAAQAAYCIRPMTPQRSAAYCIKPVSERSSAAYCIRPMKNALSAN